MNSEYISKKEIYDCLRERAAWINFPHHGEEFPTEDAKLMMDAADAIEERCQQVDKFMEESARLYAKLPRWIPVTERLPEKRDWYLVLTHDLEYFVCDYIPSVNQWWALPGDDWIVSVTHWVPLPEPPKEETK